MSKWLADLEWDLNKRSNPSIALEKQNKLAKTANGDGFVLSSNALPTYGEYHIPLRVSHKYSFIGLKAKADGRNYNPSDNCIYWNDAGIYKNGERLSDEKIKEGRVGISVTTNEKTMMVQFVRDDHKVYEEIELDSSYPVYLMGLVDSNTNSTVEILTP